MKKTSLLLSLLILAGCAAQPLTTFSYSGDFRLDLPARLLAGATLFSTTELSARTEDGKLISGMVLTPDMDQLPPDFDMQEYPGHIFNPESRLSLSAAEADLFEATAEEIDQSYGLDNVQVIPAGDFTIYLTCKAERCLALVAKTALTSQILSIHANGFSREEFHQTLEQGL